MREALALARACPTPGSRPPIRAPRDGHQHEQVSGPRPVTASMNGDCQSAKVLCQPGCVRVPFLLFENRGTNTQSRSLRSQATILSGRCIANHPSTIAPRPNLVRSSGHASADGGTAPPPLSLSLFPRLSLLKVCQLAQRSEASLLPLSFLLQPAFPWKPPPHSTPKPQKPPNKPRNPNRSSMAAWSSREHDKQMAASLRMIASAMGGTGIST